MIIGEPYNDYYGHGEENYDYLFKRKTKEERQQKKEGRKEKRAEKKVIREGKQEEKKLQKETGGTGGKRKLPILGNFGLFDKNKKKTTTPGGTTRSSSEPAVKRETDESPSSSRAEESRSTPEIKTAAPGTGAAAATADKNESGSSAASDSGARSEGAKAENTTQDNAGNAKKEAGTGAIFGWVFLGLVVTVIGVVLYNGGKKVDQVTQPVKMAA